LAPLLYARKGMAHAFVRLYPAALETRPPVRFERVQVGFRLLVLLVLGVVHQSGGRVFAALYLLLPLVAAFLILRKGGARFLAEDSRWLVSVLAWVLALSAYLLFVTDDFPLGPSTRHVHLRVRPGGTPTAGGALLRLVTSVPHALLLLVYGVASAVLSLPCAIAVLITERCPDGLHRFQGEVIAWSARVLAYHASLVEPYPPFSLHPGGARAPTNIAPPAAS
jgi:hypothetical protein